MAEVDNFVQGTPWFESLIRTIQHWSAILTLIISYKSLNDLKVWSELLRTDQQSWHWSVLIRKKYPELISTDQQLWRHSALIRTCGGGKVLPWTCYCLACQWKNSPCNSGIYLVCLWFVETFYSNACSLVLQRVILENIEQRLLQNVSNAMVLPNLYVVFHT